MTAGSDLDRLREGPEFAKSRPRRRGLLVVGGFLAVATVVAAALVVVDRRDSRDPWKRPFRSDSIWNTPIGSRAEYVPAGLPVAEHGTSFDRVYLLRSDADDPLRDLVNPGSWTERCSGTEPTGRSLQVPDDLLISDAQQQVDGEGFHTPNNGLVLLRPDGRFADNTNGVARCDTGGAVFGYSSGDSDIDVTDIYGDGLLGSHGASRLNWLGGTLREGELEGEEPIQHVLDLVVWARHLSYVGGGHRWPAADADSYASAQTYTGTNLDLRMGSLVALPTDVTPEGLQVSSAAGRKLFAALQDYGAYITDDAAWDHHYLAAEASAYEGTGWGQEESDELNRMVSALSVVVNNSPASVGGGGEPRRPLLPELDDPN